MIIEDGEVVEVGTYVMLWTEDSACCRCVEEDAEVLFRAVSTYIDTRRDSLICLTTLAGATYPVKASIVTSWMIVTPESRELDDEIDRAINREKKKKRQPWEED